MKKHLLVSALAATLVLAGCNNTAKNQTKETSTAITEQSSEVQKVGYSLGFDMGQNLKEGADDMDLEAFYTGLKDAYANKDGALTREQMEGVMRTYLERKQAEMSKKTEEKAAANKTAGAAFLAENAKKRRRYHHRIWITVQSHQRGHWRIAKSHRHRYCQLRGQAD